MKSSQTTRSRPRSLFSTAALWAAALLITALISGVWFLLAAVPAGYAAPAAAAAAITAAVGFTRQQSRARTNRRKAALDMYAEREIVRAATRSGQLHSKRRLATATALNKS